LLVRKELAEKWVLEDLLEILVLLVRMVWMVLKEILEKMVLALKQLHYLKTEVLVNLTFTTFI
jgi:hypothetical protein